MAQRSSKTIALGAIPVMSLAFLAGCGGEDEVAYCVDGADTVVDNSYCNDDFNDGTYFWSFIAASQASKIVKGSKIKKASQKIASNNKAALAKRGGFGAATAAGIGVAVAHKSGGGSSGGS